MIALRRRYDNWAAQHAGKAPPHPQLDQHTDESESGFNIPLWMAEEFVFVAETWHIPPREWLATPPHYRSAMLKVLRLRATAEHYRKQGKTWTNQYFLREGEFDREAYDALMDATDPYAHLDAMADHEDIEAEIEMIERDDGEE